jgi:cobalt-zinc-cadmium efflux system outer membrane protein
LVLVAAATPARASGVLTLDQAVRRALKAHPAPRAARLLETAAEAAAPEAGRLSNPALAVEVENWGADLGTDRREATVALTQTLERGGDRAARAGAARARAGLASAAAGATRLEVAGLAVEAFLDAWAAERSVALERAAEAVAAEAVRAAAERLRAGAAPAFEQVRAEGFLGTRALERRRAEAARDAARRRLAGLWGAASLDVDSLALAEPGRLAIPPGDTLVARARAHPRQAVLEAEARLGEWRVREARAARSADLALSAGVRHLAEDGAVGLVAGASLPLPLWNAARGPVRAAEAERDAARLGAEGGRLRLEEEVRTAADRLRAALDVWDTARTRVRPAAEEALRLLAQAYRAGRLGYLDIAEGQRSLLEAEHLAVDAMADAWRARLALERLTGTPLAADAEAR